MNIGLFLDVDNTLTCDLIQRQFARLLGVSDDYEAIEGAFQQQTITSEQFAERLIELFNGAGFSKQFAQAHFDAVKQRPWTADILNLPLALPVTVYLVSSGPSYYVKPLARLYKISEENVLCSEYGFDETGKLNSCRPVSTVTKSSFVSLKRLKHRITIGVGDNEKFDGPFVSNCDIPILSCAGTDYLNCSGLDVIRTLVDNLSRLRFPRKNMTPKVAIFSSKEAVELANALQGKLEENSACEGTVWPDIFRPSHSNMENLEDALKEYDFAVFIMQPDDRLECRGEMADVVRANVLFELGLFLGRFGRLRCFCIVPEENAPELPSDLHGLVHLTYKEKRVPDNIDAAMNPVATKIRGMIADKGCRDIQP